MDGFKRRLRDSVQLRLSITLSLAILIVALLAGAFAFVSAFDEAHEMQDDVLRQVAALFDRQHMTLQYPSADPIVSDDDDSKVIVQYLADSEKASGNNDAVIPLPFPTTLADGLSTLTIAGEQFRVLVRTTAEGRRIVVAQEADVRDKQALHPINESHLPTEIRPFVVAINRLLKRVEQAMEAQRRFIADAAHELRSPMTALSLQAERLKATQMSADAAERFLPLAQGIERSRKLIEQLLALAAAQSITERPQASVSIHAVFRRVLEDLLPLAEHKNIDIGVESLMDVQVIINEMDLFILLKNLVDNAIRYTPSGGRVDLKVGLDRETVIIEIKDSGPGISVAEQLLVFDPFYRSLGTDETGSGLGLSIVTAIADRTGARIQLSFSDEVKQSGLRVSVWLKRR